MNRNLIKKYLQKYFFIKYLLYLCIIKNKQFDKFLIEKGIYSFLKKRGFAISEMKKVLRAYGRSYGNNRPKNSTNQWYLDASNHAQENFNNFRKISANHQPCENYQDFGNLAYNGVTDDF
jgi:hypothetical protein